MDLESGIRERIGEHGLEGHKMFQSSWMQHGLKIQNERMN